MTYSYEHVTVFLPTGETLRFHEVTEFRAIAGEATFKYKSASDGKVNSANLFLNQVVMIAGAGEREEVA